ncbi:hypothetical protein [Rubripirellula reticaptiva]|uniref:hypothetical protein n=1 Tax=Rubripirellula reticaptiva TaxID=2528013 RepID=UPI001648B7B0|nr:hypothetical protein [Rubripirellula reticaptiva]
MQEHNRLTQYFRSPNVFNGWLPGVSKEKKLTGLSSHSVIDDYQLPNMYARFSQWLPFVGTSDLFWNESRFLLSCLVEFSTHQLMGNPERLRVNHHNRLLDSALSQIALMKKRANDEQLIELLVIRGQLNRKRVPGKFTCWDKDDPNPDASQKKAALHQKAIKDFKRAQALARKLDDRSMEAKIESIIHHEMMALARVLAKRGTPKDLRASVDIQRKFPGFLSMYEQSEDLTMPQPILSTKFDLVASIALAKDGQVREALATLNQCKSRLVMNNIQNNRLEHSAVLLAWKIGSAHGIRTNDSPTTGSDELERAMNYFNSESPTQLDCFVEVPSVVAHLDGHSS